MTTITEAKTSYLRGMDISEFQPTVDWTKVAAEKFDFCFIRASHGGQPDAKFASHRAGARSINLPAGFYHYLNPVVAIDTQVKNLVQMIGSFNPGELRPVVDVEGADAWAPVARNTRLGLITQFLNGVKQDLKVKPIVYLSLNFIKQVIDDPSVDVSVLGDWDLWIAEYGLQPGVDPTLPSPWTVWKFWQFSAKTTVAGIDGDVDGDYFNGTKAQLASFAVIPAVISTPTADTAIASSNASAVSRSSRRRRTSTKKKASTKTSSNETSKKTQTNKPKPRRLQPRRRARSLRRRVRP
jgi:lysozyme